MAKSGESLCNTFLKNIVSDWIVYMIGYSLMFILGLRMKQIDQKRERNITLLIFIVAVGMLGYHIWMSGFSLIKVQNYKYPPQSYYLIYGLLMCSILWNCRKVLVKYLNNKVILFIGKNTIWIYLYHIFFLYLTSVLPLHLHWLVRYAIVYTLAVSVTFVQYMIASKYDGKRVCKYLIG